MSILEKLRKMFEGFANHQAAAETVRGVLEKYLSNERPFAASIDKKSLGDSSLLTTGLIVVQYMFIPSSDQQIKTPACHKPWGFSAKLFSSSLVQLGGGEQISS